MTASISTADYWNNRYLQNETGWDMGIVSPPLKTYFDQLPDKTISILIPGGGNSYEAGYLLEQAFTHITVIDISEVLVNRLKEKFPEHANQAIHTIANDFFNLTGQYDLIIEQTFFCALDPDLRNNYVKKMGELLKPGGKLIGLLFDRVFEGGPPFGGSKEEYEKLLKTQLTIKTLEPCYNSIQPRAGTELFMIAEKLA